MSKLEVDKIDPQSGTNLELGTSGDTITIPTGVTLDASNATTTLPANVVTTDGTQTLTNKTIDASQLSGTITPSDGTVTSAKISYPLTTFSSTGIDDNSNATAITIDSDENITFHGSSIFRNVNNSSFALAGGTSSNVGGNITLYGGASGIANGIKFRAAGTEIMRMTSNGLTFNGDTAAANALDDYEEGSFTAELSSTGATFTYTVRQGWYVKVGNRVMFNIYIQLDGTPFTTTSNNTYITGFPFTSGNLSGNENRMICGTRLVNFSSGQTFLMANLSTNSNTALLIQGGDNSTGVPLPSNALSNSSGQIFLSGSYQTA